MGVPFVDYTFKIESVPEKIVILHRLQDEKKQIKREFPLCISLLDQAIAALQDEISKKFQNLHDNINRLQDEKKKIEAFKHKLPCYMLLLSGAIAYALDELALYNKYNSGDYSHNELYELSSKGEKINQPVEDQILETCSSSSSC